MHDVVVSLEVQYACQVAEWGTADFCVEYGFVSGRTHNKALLNMKFDVCMDFKSYPIMLASSCNDSFCHYCMLMLTSFSQLSQAGHERW